MYTGKDYNIVFESGIVYMLAILDGYITYFAIKYGGFYELNILTRKLMHTIGDFSVIIIVPQLLFFAIVSIVLFLRNRFNKKYPLIFLRFAITIHIIVLTNNFVRFLLGFNYVQ